MLLECLTGRRVYDGSAIEAAVARLHRQPLVPDHLPFELARLLTLMTSLHPRQRPSAHECARILRAIGRSEAVGSITIQARVQQRPWRSRRQALLAAALSILLVAVGSADVAPVSDELLVAEQPVGPRAGPAPPNAPAMPIAVRPDSIEPTDSPANAQKGAQKNKGGKEKPKRGKGKHGS